MRHFSLSPFAITFSGIFLSYASIHTSHFSYAASSSTQHLTQKIPAIMHLEQVATFKDFKLVGIGVSQEGRIFASAPQAKGDEPKVVEVDPKTGSFTPYPDKIWNQLNDQQADAKQKWVVSQAMWVDTLNRLWVLDTGRGEFHPKLVAFNLKTDKPIYNFSFDRSVSQEDSLNDVRIDTQHNYAYLTNVASSGGLVILNLKTGESRQVLRNDRSTRSKPGEYLYINGQPAFKNGKRLVLHADGIALSHDMQWLYYRPLTDHNYWRIKTEYLRNDKLSDTDLSHKVEFLGTGPMSGGIIIDKHNILYGGDLEKSTIVALRLSPITGKLGSYIFAKDPRLSWADGFAISQGYLYIADSHLWEHNFDQNRPVTGPYRIFRVKLPE